MKDKFNVLNYVKYVIKFWGIHESFHVVVKFVFFGDPFDIDTPDDERLGYLQDAGGPTDIDLYGASEEDPLKRNLRRALTIGAFMAVILMNIFIAILSKNYETALEAAESREQKSAEEKGISKK
eukprot:6476623-Amphidinium_carterae.1